MLVLPTRRSVYRVLPTSLFDLLFPSICSREFDPVDHRELFLLVTVALARADLRRLWFDPIIVAGTNTLPLPMPDYHELREKLDLLGEQTRFVDLRELYGSPSGYEIPLSTWKDSVLRLTCELDGLDILASDSGDSSTQVYTRRRSTSSYRRVATEYYHRLPDHRFPLHVQAGATGRGTIVLPLACPDDNASLQARDVLLAKMSWQPVNRMAEDETLRIIRRKIPKAWMKHVTDLKCSTTLNGDTLNLPRKDLMVFIEARVNAVAALRKPKRRGRVDKHEDFLEMADAFIGQDYKERVLRVLVTPRYLPLCEVNNLTEFKTVFRDVAKVHYVIYTSCNILHRDLSVNNIMFTRHDEQVVGILNDWDLAASTSPKDEATSKHPPGTVPFMALDLLWNAGNGKPQPHEYHHDLQSFLWILIWCAFSLRFNANQVESAKLPDMIQEWAATDASSWRTIATTKWTFAGMGESYLTFMTPEMKPLRKSWIRPVLRQLRAFAWSNTNVVHSESEEESGPDSDRAEEDTDTGKKDVGFTFVNIMKVLEREMEKPDVTVWDHGPPVPTVD
ncbi:uncharacterized protein STEHIDRAFT_158453 [Stereum hirsutum FP-91666 SS1]|uniref:uncharacterized protein n=1 Tax=Stereum hirsutum (strain FP-91666) TaxID=721885 RepID=UPI000444A717|nr:uncharacterized protein STEHIDRAFT_158453 [Stereum hirsutum FP-91666 SS1]EIM84737.1 hypothetical protein STEHIDRAFT_158453 [Stereum hirsutum FP-91666 SS1]